MEQPTAGEPATTAGRGYGRAPAPWGTTGRTRVVRPGAFALLAGPALGAAVGVVLAVTWGDGEEYRGIGFLALCAVLTLVELRTRLVVTADVVQVRHSFGTYVVDRTAIAAVVPSPRGNWGRLELADGTTVATTTMLGFSGRPRPKQADHIPLTSIPVDAAAAALQLPVAEPSELDEENPVPPNLKEAFFGDGQLRPAGWVAAIVATVAGVVGFGLLLDAVL